MVILIVRDMTGGIRKHIVSVLESFAPQFEGVQLITNLSLADRGFQQFLRQYPQFHARILDVKIRRAPHPQDLLVLVRLYLQLRYLHASEAWNTGAGQAQSSARSGAHPVVQATQLVFHGHGAKGGMLARLLGRMMGGVTFYTPHGGSVHRMHGLLQNWLYLLVEKFLFYFTDGLVFESRYTQDVYVDTIHGPTAKHQIILNYNGVDFSVPRRPEAQVLHTTKPFRIGAFGALRALKGYDLLIQAVHLLHQRGYAVEARIYGHGEELANLQALAKGLQIADCVHLGLDTQDVLTQMRGCDVVVQPSRFESFGYSALEAVSCGVPVVVASAGGLTEIVQDEVTGRVFPVGDYRALADALADLIDHPEERLRLAQSAYERAQKLFDEKAMVQKLRELYARQSVS